jgi:dihydroorotate dehydrogenase (fumarate)
MIIFIETWMNEKGYKTITDFKGIMNYGKIGDPDVYERSQFMKYFSSHE